MCIISKQRIAFHAKVEGTLREIFALALITLQSRLMCVAKKPVPMYVHTWLQRQSDCVKLETDK
jgi:hypothetical protein